MDRMHATNRGNWDELAGEWEQLAVAEKRAGLPVWLNVAAQKPYAGGASGGASGRSQRRQARAWAVNTPGSLSFGGTMKDSSIEMPHAGLFERALSAKLGGSKAADVVQAARARYGKLYAGREQYDNGSLRRHLEENLLPGVALYRALLADLDTREEAMPLFEVAIKAWAASQRRSLERLARLPAYYWLMRAVIKPMMRSTFPEEGWETEWVQANGQALAFNMKSCFYLDVLGAYGVPELAIQYCRMDDLIYKDLSPHVRWVRQGTLGRGDRHCDFRFERVKG